MVIGGFLRQSEGFPHLAADVLRQHVLAEFPGGLIRGEPQFTAHRIHPPAGILGDVIGADGLLFEKQTLLVIRIADELTGRP